MEKNFYNDEFEQLLKEKSDSFRMYPSKRVWHSIYNDLHPGRKWPSIAMGLSLIIALIFIGYINNNEAGSKETNSRTNIAGLDNGTATATGDAENNNITGNNINGSDQHLGDSKFSNLLSALRQPLYDGTAGNNAYSPAFDPYIVALVNNNSNNNRKAASKLSYTRRGRFAMHAEKGTTGNYITDAGDRSAANSNTDNAGDIEDTDAAATARAGKNTAASSTTATIADADNSENNVTTLTADSIAAAQKKALPAATASNYQQAADKAWLENYAFYNKNASKNKWKGRMDVAFYVTPNIGYRKLTGGAVYDANPLTAVYVAQGDVGNTVDHKPALGIEAGTAFAYSLTKKIQVKAGLQFNYTSYAINAGTTYHPVLTSLLLTDPATGLQYTSSRISNLSNETPGSQPVKVFNTTYQVSLPVGFAVKLLGNSKVSWYAGASFQPTYIFGGNANLLSSDRRNYISESSMLHNWNFNTGAETYLSYKLNGYSLQVGPQFRYQLMSTYDKKYVNSERLYNTGIKIGIVKKL